MLGHLHLVYNIFTIWTLFTARPEAQRCQVTPYVVNVLVVVVLLGGGPIARYEFVSLLKPS